MKKTNAMRILEDLDIAYKAIEYDPKTEVNGEVIAKVVQEEADHVYKTLVTEDHEGNFYVFCLPVPCHLDLKKAARACGAKKVEMLAMKNLQKVTGYIRGGVSPIGMKKDFPCYLQEIDQDKICLSGGKKGHQIKVNPKDLVEKLDFHWADVVKE